MSDYQQAVTEARTLVKRSEDDQWRLAQLTWENASPFEGDGKKSLAEWGRDAGIHKSYASRLYKVWDSYGSGREVDDVDARPSFNEAYLEVSPSSAYRPRQPDPRDALPPKAKADLMREWMQDPDDGAEVAEALTSNPDATDRLYRAARAAKIEQARSQQEPPPPPKTDQKQERVIRIERVADELIGRLADVLDPDLDRNGQTLVFLAQNLDALSDSYRQRLARAVKELSARASEWEDRMLGIADHTITPQHEGGAR